MGFGIGLGKGCVPVVGKHGGLGRYWEYPMLSVRSYRISLPVTA